MSVPGEPPVELNVTPVLEWIDEVADRFEAAWKCQPRPTIADFLGSATGPQRTALLAELVRIDLEYRWQAGERRQLEEYLRDFPELSGPDGVPPEPLVLHAWQVWERYAAEARRTQPVVVSGIGPQRQIDLHCPQCGNRMAGVESDTREVTCSNCGNSFRIEPGAGPVFRSGELPRPLGRFQLLELLGRGSFGAVYKAHDSELDRLVAIKVPRAGFFASAEEEERFLREARSAAQLAHPSIVQVHEITREGEMPYLVCDYIEGRTLAQQMADRRPGYRPSAELVAQIADALDHAHRSGVVHRDVNPRNILIDAASRPHVTDFGLARRDEGSILLTRDGQVLGTPAYMAPEQAVGEQDRVDGRSDVYSLGVILYELLTGELPFRGSIRMVLHQVIHDEPRTPRRLNDRIPRDLETICLKAMAKLPARRYATAGDLAADLRRFLRGEPIRARPVGRMERLGRWCWRNPVVASLMAAVLTLLLVVAIGATWTALHMHYLVEQERRARADAEHNYDEAQESRSQLQASRGVLLLEAGNTLGLLDLLEVRKRVEGSPRAVEARGLQWSGWYSACADRLVQVVGHDAPVHTVAFGPDGRLLATASKDGSVRLWDARTGQPHGAPFPQLPDMEIVAFSPDGKLLATITHQLVPQLWEIATGKPYGADLQRASGGGLLAISPDGKLLATVSGPPLSVVQLWEIATGQPHGKAMAHDDQVLVLAFGPDGRLLATGCNHGSARLWDTSTGKPHGQPMGHKGRIHALAFSPDGKRLATASWDNTARLWDTATGEPRSEPLLHREHLHAVAFSPDGQLLATGSFDGTARLWDVTTGRPHGQPLPHDGAVLTLAFGPDSKLLATGSLDGLARLWDPATGQLRDWPFRHQRAVHSLVFHPDGRLLATASSDGTARIWNLTARAPQVLEHPHRLWAVEFAPDGRHLVTGSEDGRARVWDLEGGARCLHVLPHPEREVIGVAISPDGKLLATAGARDTVRLWTLATGARHHVFAQPEREFRKVAFSPDGKLLVAAGERLPSRAGARPRGGIVLLCDPATGELSGELLPAGRRVEALAFSPDGRRLATGSTDGSVQLWDPATRQPHLPPLMHGGSVEAVAFSPNGRLLASASRDLTVRLWDTATGEPHGQPLRQQAAVQELAFSPDSTLLATASADGKARLWDPATGLPCGPALSHGGFMTSVVFRPDGRLLATGSFDKTVRLWPVPALVTDQVEMERRTWVALGARLNEQGVVEAIAWRAWQELREQLRARQAR